MTTQTLTIPYNGAGGSALANRVTLEQQPVSSAQLTDLDLQTMLAMVRSGISARAYRPPACEASMIGDQVQAELGLYVWPSRLDLDYTITPALVTAGPVTALAMERDFDLVVGMTDQVELPFYAESIRLTWQTPCYDATGAEVDRPELTAAGNRICLSATVFGVLRVRCVARGYRHALTFAMAKTGDLSITGLKPSATVTWDDGRGEQSDSIDLELPACLTGLLAACDDGSTIRERVFGTAGPGEELVPVIYYTPCSGRMLQIRNERP